MAKLLPISPSSNELRDKVHNCAILFRLINTAQLGAIFEKAILSNPKMNIFQIIEDLNMTIS